MYLYLTEKCTHIIFLHRFITVYNLRMHFNFNAILDYLLLPFLNYVGASCQFNQKTPFVTSITRNN